MRSQFRRPAKKQTLAAWFLVLAAAALVCLCAGKADASYYKMLICAGNVGAPEFTTETNTRSEETPAGIFTFENRCGPAGDPAGGSAYVRIAENSDKGGAGVGAFGRFSWTAPEGVQIAAAGGYTREPYVFEAGWRARYWVEGFDASANNILLQGSGLSDGEINAVTKATTSTFASHLWPFPNLGAFRKFSFELLCVRSSGCDRKDYNAADSNTMLLTLSDPSPPVVAVAEGALSSGRWVKGAQPIAWTTTEVGSGLRDEHLRVDGADRGSTDYRAACDLGQTEASGEFARVFTPCPRGGPFAHTATIDTSNLADGAHAATVCAQDYGQAVGGVEEACEARTIRTDNHAPAAPLSLTIGSANPARYLPTVSASWSLPADQGSPITKVHYWITDAAGNEVVPERVVAATNPVGLPAIAGPSAPGDYRLNVALEDEVGFLGAAAVVAIPHDTTPPSAPQDISVTPPSATRASRGFDVEWRNIVDSGSPIVAAHYEILDTAGNVVVGERVETGENPESIAHLATPKGRGSYELRVWSSDAEGNVGAPTSAPLAFDCVRSEVKGAVGVSATFGAESRNQIVVPFGSGATLSGRLQGAGGRELARAPVCVFSRITTLQKRRFLGVAVTDDHGAYAYPVPAGASREIVVENRPGQRTIHSAATLVVRAHPTFEVVSPIPAHNKRPVRFEGRLPGPLSGEVSLALQIKDGENWIAIRDVTTGPDGRYRAKFRFTQTHTPLTYTLRAVMLRQREVPYRPGASNPVELAVRP